MHLDLTLHASGKIELNLTQANELGCEVRNGKLRVINSLEPSNKIDAKATAGITSSIHFGLSLAKALLADVGLQAGAEASLTSTIHLYDEYNNHEIVESDLPLDVLEECADGNGNVLICGDINAYWVLNVVMNSKKSLLGKLGLNQSFDILNNEKKSLIPGGKKHIENFQFVNSCTRKNRSSQAHSTIKVYDKITLQKYSIITSVNQQNQIQIIGLPSGYTKEDLQFSSSDPSIVTVDDHGNVTGIKNGSAIIFIMTKDGAHTIKCNVLVKES